MNFFLTKGMKWLGGKFVGYRTIAGGVGLILTGIIGVVNLVWPGTVPHMPEMDLDAIMAAISGGLVAIGIGGKLEKNTEAVKEASSVIPEAARQSIITRELTEDQWNDLNHP